MLFRACLLFAVVLGLAGCGFEPLYRESGPTQAGGAAAGVEAELAAIEIVPIPDRAGQRLHNILLDRLQPGGRTADRYRLETTLNITRTDLGVAVDATTQRARVTVSAQFRLVSDGREIYRFSSRSASSFNTIEADYASVVAERDAVERSLTDIGNDARLRLAAFFTSRSSG